MTVDELIEKLASLPGDTKVVVTSMDPYGEYLTYDEVSELCMGHHTSTITGGQWTTAEKYGDERDCVLLI